MNGPTAGGEGPPPSGVLQCETSGRCRAVCSGTLVVVISQARVSILGLAMAAGVALTSCTAEPDMGEVASPDSAHGL